MNADIAGGQSSLTNAKTLTRSKWSQRLWRLLAVVLLSALAIDAAYPDSPERYEIPKDELFIERFEKFRPEFDKMVELYAGTGKLDSEYASRAGLERVNPLSGLWAPDPYSINTAKKLRELSKSRRNKPVEEWPNFRPYEPISFYLKGYHRFDVSRFGWYLKTLDYIPEVPKIENGQLLKPGDELGRPGGKSPVLPSLDMQRPQLEEGDCAYRQLEAKWFISLCRGSP
ncbi:MAG: hypothetical protein AB7Q97_22970 [Gammaproteobacteria bacterium]